MSVIGWSGRSFQIAINGTPVAAVRTKRVAYANEAIDITEGENNGWRRLAERGDVRSIDINVDGVCTSANWPLLQAWYESEQLQQVEIRHADGSVEGAEAFLGALSLQGSTDGFVEFQTVFSVSGRPRPVTKFYLTSEPYPLAIDYVVEVFTDISFTFTPPDGVTSVDVALVGHGGSAMNAGFSGAALASGGGGGGEVLWITGHSVSGPVSGAVPVAADSPVTFGPYVATSGAGGYYLTNSQNGASGAGGGVRSAGGGDPLQMVSVSPGASLTDQGDGGGAAFGVTAAGFPNGRVSVGGGGGGAGGHGGSGVVLGNPAIDRAFAGNGGDGRYLGHLIGYNLGECGWFAGGGGGSVSESGVGIESTVGRGGRGGGGAGSMGNVTGEPGVDFTGGGGGGTSGAANSDPSGGRGVVIVRYVAPGGAS